MDPGAPHHPDVPPTSHHPRVAQSPRPAPPRGSVPPPPPANSVSLRSLLHHGGPGVPGVPGVPGSPPLPSPRRPGQRRRAGGPHRQRSGERYPPTGRHRPRHRLFGDPLCRTPVGSSSFPTPSSGKILARGVGCFFPPSRLLPGGGHHVPRFWRFRDVEPQPGDERRLSLPQHLGTGSSTFHRSPRLGLDLRRWLLQRSRLLGRLRRTLPRRRRRGGGGLHELPGRRFGVLGFTGTPGSAG